MLTVVMMSIVLLTVLKRGPGGRYGIPVLTLVKRRPRASVWSRWLDSPARTTPILWRLFMGRYQRVPAGVFGGGGTHWTDGKITPKDGKITISGSLIPEVAVRQIYARRVMWTAICITLLILSFSGIHVFFFGMIADFLTKTWSSGSPANSTDRDSWADVGDSNAIADDLAARSGITMADGSTRNQLRTATGRFFVASLDTSNHIELHYSEDITSPLDNLTKVTSSARWDSKTWARVTICSRDTNIILVALNTTDAQLEITVINSINGTPAASASVNITDGPSETTPAEQPIALCLNGAGKVNLAWVDTVGDVHYMVQTSASNTFTDQSDFEDTIGGTTDQSDVITALGSNIHVDLLVSGTNVLIAYSDNTSLETKKKVNNVLWADGSVTTNNFATSKGQVRFCQKNDTPDHALLVYRNSSNIPRARFSTDFGATYAAEEVVLASARNNGGLSYDGQDFFLGLDTGGVTPTIIKRTTLGGTWGSEITITEKLPSDAGKQPHIRWHNSEHSTSPYEFQTKLDIMWRNDTVGSIEHKLFDNGEPDILDSLEWDATGTGTCTFPDAAADTIQDFSVSSGFGGSVILSRTAILDIEGAMNVDDGTVIIRRQTKVTTGSSIITITSGGKVQLEGTSTTFLRADTITTTGTGIFEMLSIDGISHLICEDVNNGGSFNFTTISLKLYKITSTSSGSNVIWANNAPNFAGAPASSVITLGDGSLRGINFSQNNVDVTTGAAGITLNLFVDNLFKGLTLSTGDTINGNDTNARCLGDVNFSVGTFNAGNSDWQMIRNDASPQTLTVAAENFNKLRFTGTSVKNLIGLTTVNDLFENSSELNKTGGDLRIEGNIGAFDNSSGTIQDSNFVVFRAIDTDQNPTLDNLGIITIAVQIEGQSAAGNTILLGDAIWTTQGNVVITSTGLGTDTRFDTNTNEFNVLGSTTIQDKGTLDLSTSLLHNFVDLTINTGGELDGASAIFGSSGNVDFSNGLYTTNSSKLVMTGNKQLTLANGQDLNSFTIGAAVTVTISVTDFFDVFGTYESISGGTLNLGSKRMFLNGVVATAAFNNETGSGGTITGSGSVNFFNGIVADNFGTLTVNVVFNNNTGTTVLTMGSVLTTTLKITISNGGTSMELNSGGFAINCGDFDSSDADTILTAGASVITPTGDIDLSGCTLNQDTSTFVLNGDGTKQFITGVNSRFFYNLTIDADTELPAVALRTIITNIYDGNAVFTLTANTLEIGDTGLAFFDNSGGEITGVGGLLTFRPESTGDKTVGTSGKFGTLTVDKVRVELNGSADLLFGDTFTTTGTFQVRDTSGSAGLFNSNDQAMNFNDFEFVSGNAPEMTAGATVFTCSGNMDFTGGIFNRDTSEIKLTQVADGAFLKIDTNALNFYKVTLTGGGKTFLSTANLDMRMHNALNNSVLLNLDDAPVVNLELEDIAAIEGFVNTGTIDGNGSRILVLRLSGSADWSDIGTLLNLNVTIQGVAGAANVLQLDDQLKLTTSGSLVVRNQGGTDTILDTQTENLDIADLTTINSGATLQTGVNAALASWTFGGNVTISGDIFVTITSLIASQEFNINMATGKFFKSDGGDTTFSGTTVNDIKINYTSVNSANDVIFSSTTAVWEHVKITNSSLFDAQNGSDVSLFNVDVTTGNATAFRINPGVILTKMDNCVMTNVGTDVTTAAFIVAINTVLAAVIKNCTFTNTGAGAMAIRHTGTGFVEFQDCSLSPLQVSMDPTGDTGAIILDGAVANGSDKNIHLWGGDFIAGRILLPSDVTRAITSASIIQPKENDGPAVEFTQVVVTGNITVAAWKAEPTTITTIDGGDVVISPSTTETSHSLGVTNIDNNKFEYVGTNPNVTLEVLGDVLMNGGNLTYTPAATGHSVVLSDDVTIKVSDSLSQLLLGGSQANRLAIDPQSGGDPTNRGNIRFTDCADTTVINYIDFGVLGNSNSDPENGTIVIDGDCTGLLEFSTFPGSIQARTLRFGDGTDCHWTVRNNQVGTGNGKRGIHIQGNCPNLKILNTSIFGNTPGQGILIHLATAIFFGLIENCTFMNGSVGLDAINGVRLGSMRNCVFSGTAMTTFIDVAAGKTVELAGCLFDEDEAGSKIVLGAGSQLISWLHNNTNNRKTFIGSNFVITSATESVVNFDSFNWQFASAGDWDINGNNQFESSGDVGVMKSIFIPVAPSTTYYLKYEGSATVVVSVNSYQVDQVTSPTSGDTSDNGFTLSGSDFEATIAVGSDAVFLQWEVDASAAAEIFHNIEIREADSIGDLIFNEDLLNNYLWDTGVDYLSGTDGGALFFSPGSQNIIFGDVDYDELDLSGKLAGIGSDTNFMSFIIGWVSAIDYYYLLVEQDTGIKKVTLKKVELGVETTIGSATTYDGVAATIDFTEPIDFLINWQEDESGSFRVTVNGILIDSGGWGTINDYLIDTTFLKGRVGYKGSSASIDSVLIEQQNFFLRDNDLCLKPGVLITVDPTGRFDYKRGIANTSRTSIIRQAGSIFIDEAVQWTDNNFNEIVNNIQQIACTIDPVKVSGNIVLGSSGSLTLEGVIMEHENRGTSWTIITEASTVSPPITTRAAHFRGLNSRFRPVDGTDPPYEINQDGKREVLDNGPEPIHPVHVVSQQVFGRSRNRNSIRGFGDLEVTLTFTTVKDLCLYGKFARWRDNKTVFEAIWPQGYISRCIVADLDPIEATEALIAVTFSVRLKEFQ